MKQNENAACLHINLQKRLFFAIELLLAYFTFRTRFLLIMGVILLLFQHSEIHFNSCQTQKFLSAKVKKINKNVTQATLAGHDFHRDWSSFILMQDKSGSSSLPVLLFLKKWFIILKHGACSANWTSCQKQETPVNNTENAQSDSQRYLSLGECE